TMGDEKMSKSIGNVKLVKDLRKEYDPDVLRFFLATAHYRRPLTYSETALADAKANITHIKTAIGNRYHRLETAVDSLLDDPERKDKWYEYIICFSKATYYDFQTQIAMTTVSDMIRLFNRRLEEPEVSREAHESTLNDFIQFLA